MYKLGLNILILAVLAAGLLSVPTVAVGASGQLFDQNKNPVADAWVVATRKECNGFAHCSTFCVEVRVAKTDAQGKYAFGSDRRSLSAYDLTAYLNRYLPTSFQGVRSVGFHMERGGSDPRFSKLDVVSGRIAHLVKTASEMACFSSPKEQRAALIPVYQAMFREAISIARFPEHQNAARRICAEMYWTQLRPADPAYSADVEHIKQERFLRDIEPACNIAIDDSKERGILLAIARGDPAPIRNAAREGFDFNRLLDGRSPPIVTAATNGAVEMIAELAAGGAKADVAGEDRRTALDRLLGDFSGNPARRRLVVRALLEAGASANRPDVSGFPPLVRAASWYVADAEVIELLFRYGARVDQTVSCDSCNERGRTVLHGVSDLAVARIAIARGADVNAKTQYGSTPLMYAHRPDLVRILLQHGADPNIAEGSGWTPLMRALQSYEAVRNSEHAQPTREIAEMLVAAGAKLETKNQIGVGAFYYSKDEAFKAHLRSLAAKYAANPTFK